MRQTAKTGDAFDGLPPRCGDCRIAEATERIELPGAGAGKPETTATDLCDGCAEHARRLLRSLGVTILDESPAAAKGGPAPAPTGGLQASMKPIAEHAGLRPIAEIAPEGTDDSQAAHRPAPRIGRGEARPIRHGMNGLTRDLAVIDTEWTEASIDTARIVAIGIVRLRPDRTGFMKLYTVNPKKPISSGSAAVHHLTDELVKDLPDFKTYSQAIMRDLADADLGGYSVKNDVALLEKSFQQAGFEWDPNGLAIVDALRIWQHAERRRLTDAYRRFVGPRGDDLTAHDAAGDALMSAQVLEKLTGNRSMADIDRITDPGRVDAAGKFKRNQDGDVVFDLGPHRGDDTQKHPDYLQWMQYKDFAPSTLRVVVELLDDLHKTENPCNSPELAGAESEHGGPDAQNAEDAANYEDDEHDQIPF